MKIKVCYISKDNPNIELLSGNCATADFDLYATCDNELKVWVNNMAKTDKTKDNNWWYASKVSVPKADCNKVTLNTKD